MNETWRSIWAQHGDPSVERLDLAQLIAFDGFHGHGRVSVEAWRAFTLGIRDRLLEPGRGSVFEVGCGAGAFLYPLHEAGHPVAGLDYSPRLLATAARAMPHGDWTIGEARELDGTPFDLVLANSVFQYFPDTGYADQVLSRMMAKCRRALAILDVPDRACREAHIAQRRATIGTDYDARYPASLDLLFLERHWLSERLVAGGFRVRIEQQNLSGYGSNPFRFNVLAIRSPG